MRYTVQRRIVSLLSYNKHCRKVGYSGLMEVLEDKSMLKQGFLNGQETLVWSL